MEGEPSDMSEDGRQPFAKLNSAAVFHLPQQIAGMIAKYVPASYNEVQMHKASSAPHHHRLRPWENYFSCGPFPIIYRILQKHSNHALLLGDYE